MTAKSSRDRKGRVALPIRPEHKDVVRSLRLFEGVGQAAFKALLEGSYLQRFPAQLTLITEGEPADFLHILVSGSVELFSGWNGQETTMEVVRPVSTFILAAVLKDAPYLMSARTAEASEILLVPSQNLRRGMEMDAALAAAMVVELASCYRDIVKAQKNLKLRTGVERLANYLLRAGAEQSGQRRIELQLEKRVIASLLGMTPENLSRAFQTLKPYGVIVEGAQIELTKIEDLKQFAKPAPSIDDSAY
jgi:CRP/FNR family transcriptional activator FtrB